MTVSSMKIKGTIYAVGTKCTIYTILTSDNPYGAQGTRSWRLKEVSSLTVQAHSRTATRGTISNTSIAR
jgi:hypothetical protein